jgi:hypothetical protein
LNNARRDWSLLRRGGSADTSTLLRGDEILFEQSLLLRRGGSADTSTLLCGCEERYFSGRGGSADTSLLPEGQLFLSTDHI